MNSTMLPTESVQWAVTDSETMIAGLCSLGALSVERIEGEGLAAFGRGVSECALGGEIKSDSNAATVRPSK